MFFNAVAELLRTGDFKAWMARWLGHEDSAIVGSVLGLRDFLITDV